jgi:GNAT superfamily N-acetyltransferase
MDDQLLHACDVNCWLANAAFLGTSVRGEVIESGDLFITNCGFPQTEFNRAFLKAPDGDLAAAFECAEAYFRGVGLPFAFTVRSDREAECAEALAAAGYERQAAMPAMVLAPIRDESRPVPGLEIREVTTREDLARFQEAAFEGFGFPRQAGHLFITEQFANRPGVKLYLGLLDGEPASTSSMVPTPGVAGIYWVSTLEAHRKRGLGEALTWAAVRGGIESGCSAASLQASAMGEPVYARMGFETPVYYVKYGRPIAAGPGSEADRG